MSRPIILVWPYAVSGLHASNSPNGKTIYDGLEYQHQWLFRQRGVPGWREVGGPWRCDLEVLDEHGEQRLVPTHNVTTPYLLTSAIASIRSTFVWLLVGVNCQRRLSTFRRWKCSMRKFKLQSNLPSCPINPFTWRTIDIDTFSRP